MSSRFNIPTRLELRPHSWSRRRVMVASALAGAAAVAIGVGFLVRPPAPTPEVASGASLVVSLAAPRLQAWPSTIEASGSVAAWQETIIGAQIGGLQLQEVRVNVGDRVRRGQILAVFDPAAPRAEAARLTAALAQAEAAAGQAEVNRLRAESLADSGAISTQERLRYATEAETAQAAVQAARAALEAQREQLRYAVVRAPADGVIVARVATPGSLGGVGQEMFRMIRQGRLEWRGELTAAQLSRVASGQVVELDLPDGSQARARVRQRAPSLDPQTRLGLVYADLVEPSAARAGMYAGGRILLPETFAVTVPAASVVLRDGRHYVYAATPRDGDLVVRALEVTPGRRRGAEVEIERGVLGDARVVERGAGFLKDGDRVREARPARVGAATRPAA